MLIMGSDKKDGGVREREEKINASRSGNWVG
jgi:hypothetical protein